MCFTAGSLSSLPPCPYSYVLGIIRRQLEQLIIMCFTIVDAKQLEQETRFLAVELLMTLSEQVPAFPNTSSWSVSRQAGLNVRAECHTCGERGDGSQG